MKTEQLYEVDNQVQNAINELNIHVGVIANKEATHRSVDESVSNIKNTIILVLTKVVFVLNGSVKFIAPNPWLSTAAIAIARKERKKKPAGAVE